MEAESTGVYRVCIQLVMIFFAEMFFSSLAIADSFFYPPTITSVAEYQQAEYRLQVAPTPNCTGYNCVSGWPRWEVCTSQPDQNGNCSTSSYATILSSGEEVFLGRFKSTIYFNEIPSASSDVWVVFTYDWNDQFYGTTPTEVEQIKVGIVSTDTNTFTASVWLPAVFGIILD